MERVGCAYRPYRISAPLEAHNQLPRSLLHPMTQRAQYEKQQHMPSPALEMGVRSSRCWPPSKTQTVWCDITQLSPLESKKIARSSNLWRRRFATQKAR